MASGLENIETIESPFRRFVTTIGVFPTAFTDAMTYYECLAYLVKYLEDTVIPAVNENAEALEEVQSLYVQLKSYVDNYFDNLDVQEEINNKLDEMVTSGQLQQLIDAYFAEVNQRITNLNIEVNQRLDTQDERITQVTNTTNTKLASQDGDIQTLESRMDSFSSLTEGSTTGDAELIDGRIAFDGRTYASIGDNIRNYQNAGYTDITATLTSASGYVSKTSAVQSSTGYTHYTLPTDKDKMYLIDCMAQDTAPQVVYGRGSSSLYFSIPENIASGNSYNKPVIIKGTGGTVYINNLNSNTHFYVGELNTILAKDDIYKYFTDITADCTVTSGKYRNKNGNESSSTPFNYYTIANPVVGKIYRVFTTSSTNAPIAVQRNGMCYPQNVAAIPQYDVPTYYDIYCTSSNALYINELSNSMLGTSAKIYESVFTYTTPLQQDIKSDVGAFDKAFFIGDSLTYGQTYTASNTTYRNYYNYPYYLKKLLQINEITEVARAGATAQSWWSSYNDQITQTDTCYFIWLGTNDDYTDTVATDCAGDDYTQFAETATGYLGKIVGKVASLSNVKIVMLNNFATVGTKATNNKVINDIATKFGALVIDINNTNVSDSGYHTAYNGYYNSVHFNNQGHNYVANIVANDLMTYMNSHQGSFELYKTHA